VVEVALGAAGRGGQSDVGQRVRDEILVVQSRNDAKVGAAGGGIEADGGCAGLTDLNGCVWRHSLSPVAGDVRWMSCAGCGGSWGLRRPGQGLCLAKAKLEGRVRRGAPRRAALGLPGARRPGSHPAPLPRARRVA
jgi:hypothetical protein